MKGLLQSYGATVRSVHPFTCGYEGVLLFSNYEGRYEDSLQLYRQYFVAAQFLGADKLILHGMQNFGSSDGVLERYSKRYRSLYRIGQEYGVTVAQENVTRFFSESPSFIRSLRQLLGEECAFCFDVKQSVRSQVDCYEMIEAMGDRLVHVHLSDNRPGETCLVPGQGTMDLAHLLETLHQNHFDGSVILEVYRSSFHQIGELSEGAHCLSEWIDRCIDLNF
jgi:sugar phosphate isomerase/epimerase